MAIEQLVQALEELKNVRHLKDMRASKPFRYDTRRQWFSDHDSRIPGADSNGVYFYTNRNGQVLYIGKAEYAAEGGLGYRCCAHLGAASRIPDQMFKNHQWVNDMTVSPDIKAMIEAGDFLIWTLPIQPAYFVSLIEVYLQTVYKHINSHSPPLNKKTG